jgi:hypothetical protein
VAWYRNDGPRTIDFMVRHGVEFRAVRYLAAPGDVIEGPGTYAPAFAREGLVLVAGDGQPAPQPVTVAAPEHEPEPDLEAEAVKPKPRGGRRKKEKDDG